MAEEYNNTMTYSFTQGIYVGQIDSNSVEIKVNGIPMAFFLSDKVKASFNFSNLSKDTLVNIDYFRNEHGQNILTTIEIDKE